MRRGDFLRQKLKTEMRDICNRKRYRKETKECETNRS
jgi:hypothetical protein